MESGAWLVVHEKRCLGSSIWKVVLGYFFQFFSP